VLEGWKVPLPGEVSCVHRTSVWAYIRPGMVWSLGIWVYWFTVLAGLQYWPLVGILVAGWYTRRWLVYSSLVGILVAGFAYISVFPTNGPRFWGILAGFALFILGSVFLVIVPSRSACFTVFPVPEVVLGAVFTVYWLTDLAYIGSWCRSLESRRRRLTYP
jgi:hypothetical protein